MTKPKFKHVYYVAQTKPKFALCGFCFNQEQAEHLAKTVKLLTGKKGIIICFSRDELKELKFKK